MPGVKLTAGFMIKCRIFIATLLFTRNRNDLSVCGGVFTDMERQIHQS